MDKVKNTVAALLLLMTVGCNGPSEYQWEMAQVDSLYQMVEKYQAQLDTLQRDSVMKIYDEVHETYAYLDENYPDSTDRKFWLTDMNYLARARKSLGRYDENREELHQQVNYSMHQLETLYNSLKDEKLKKDQEMTEEKAEDFLHTEARAVQSIGMKMNKIYRETRSAVVIWDSLQPHFDSIEAHLRNRP